MVYKYIGIEYIMDRGEYKMTKEGRKVNERFSDRKAKRKENSTTITTTTIPTTTLSITTAPTTGNLIGIESNSLLATYV
jgi:hypothetical protein